MSTQQIPVTLVTHEHLFKATLPSRGERILDILNDSTSDFVRIYSAHLFCRGQDTPFTMLPEVVVRKANVGLVVVTGEQHEAPQKRRNAFTAKTKYRAFLVALGYEIQGTIHLNASGDPVCVLSSEMGRFVPVQNASVSRGGICDDGLHGQVVICNHAFISALQIEKEASLALDDLTDVIGQIMNE